MLLNRRTPDHIARPNFLFRATLILHPPTSGGADQGLPERMLVPCCPSAGLERDTDSEHACRSWRLDQRVNAYDAGKILVGPLPEGCEPLLLSSICDFLHLIVFGGFK